MKSIVLILFFFSFSIACYSQVDPQKMLYIKKAEKFRRMKGTGCVLTVIGAGLFITGVVKTVDAINTYNSTGATSDEPVGLYFLGGAAGLGAGIPLWVAGGYKQRKYEKKLQSLSVRINTNQQNRGLTLTYRF
jgi:hypothetical protein